MMGFVKMFWENNAHDVYWPKLSISGQIVSEILAQLYSYDSIQILVNWLGSKRWVLFLQNILTNPIISQLNFLFLWSSIADHVKTTGHSIKWDHFDISASGETDYHCKIKVTLHKQELKPAFNVNVSSEKLMLY